MKEKIRNAGLWLYGVVCLMLLFGADAKAYIDPSVMTYVIQAVAGAAIALGAVVGIYWRRARRKIGSKIGLDETRGKEMESDEIRVTEESGS